MATVVGLFETRGDAEVAIEQLRQNGIDASNIGVVMQDREEMRDMATNAGVETGAAAATGAVAGGVLGGGLGLVLSVIGAVAIPVIGPIIAAGPIAAALVGAATGAATGGLIGALTEAGVPEEEAQVYQTGVERGGVLVTAHVTPEQEMTTRSIMQQYGSLEPSNARSMFDSDPEYRMGQKRGVYNTTTETTSTRTTDYSAAPKGSSMDEAAGGAGGAVAGGVIGAVVGGPIGAAAGAAIGGAAGAGAAHVGEEREGSNVGPMAGGATGAVTGAAIGAIGGPIGMAAGAAIGAAAGGAIGDKATQAGKEVEENVENDVRTVRDDSDVVRTTSTDTVRNDIDVVDDEIRNNDDPNWPGTGDIRTDPRINRNI